MANVQKSTNDKFWRGCGEKRTSIHCWWKCTMMLPYGGKSGGSLLLFSCPVVLNSLRPLFDPMDSSTPGLPVPHHLSEFAQVHVHCIGDCHPAISSSDSSSFCSQSFPASGIFPMSHLFTSDDQNTGASASASVFPVNIQG